MANQTKGTARNLGTTNLPDLDAIISRCIADTIAVYKARRTNNGEVTSGMAKENKDIARKDPYKEFLTCQPNSFNGKDGTDGLLGWFKQLEIVFQICNCPEDNKVKYATCTFQDNALAWWNAYVQSVGFDEAYRLTWEDLKGMMSNEYLPRNETQILEARFWDLTMEGSGITSHTTYLQKSPQPSVGMITPEHKKVEMYAWVLPNRVQGNVTFSEPVHIQREISMAPNLANQVTRRSNSRERTFENKRKWKDNFEEDNNQPPAKRHDAAKEHTATSKNYRGKKPLCNRCKLHHLRKCTVICKNCNNLGHQTKDCRGATTTDRAKAPKSCFKCGETGHFKKNCPLMANLNQDRAQGRVFIT